MSEPKPRDVAGDPPVDQRTSSISLTGRATRWIQVLQDFGHLDNDGTDRLLIFIADLAAKEQAPSDDPCARVWVDVDLVRRAAAILLARDQGESPHLPLLLEEDWPLLFS
jgi:hypothetical protein